jgi:hypothetical protein
MFSSLADVVKIPAAIFSGMAVAAVILILVYEGISLPFIGQVINGRVANAVDTATAGLVARSELTAARAQLERERELRQAADNAAVQARLRAYAADRAKAAAQSKLDEMIAADTGDDGATWTDEDLKWLAQ